MHTPPHSEDPLIGACLDGRYLVTAVLGRGGMGVVYGGVHEQLGRAVAIKVLGPDTVSDPVVVERFLREARIASSLGHGNIIDVSDLGRLQDGRPYLVMPRVHGTDFATLLECEGPLPAERVAELLRGVAAALDLVHAKGLAHRDVKPENLMHVLHEDGSETVMLMDFGIVGLIAVKAARLTADGMLCGTPAYVAPELVATGEFDRRADVYALATVAFEMITGRVPFDDVHPTRVLSAKVARRAPSLAAAADRRYAQALEAVVARGLERDPEQRFQSASAFVSALAQAAQQRACDADVVEAPTLRNLASPRPRASMPVLAAAFAVLVSIGAPLVPSAETRPRSAAHRGAPVTIASIMPSVAPAPELQPAATQDSPPTAMLPPASSIGSTAPALRGGASRWFAPQLALRDARAQAPRPRRHEPRVTAPAEVPQPQPRPTPDVEPKVQSADELNRTANQELLQGRLGSALELFERASKGDPSSAAAYRGLGVVNERLGRSADAARAYRRALELQPQGPQAAALRERLRKLQ